MKKKILFSLLSVMILCGFSDPDGQNINTGARRKVGGPACTVPTLTSKWSAFDASNDCFGACVNGGQIHTLNDSIGGNTATGFHFSTNPNATYSTNQVNGLPALFFTASLGQALSISSLNNTGSLTVYAVIKENCTSGQCSVAGSNNNGLAFYVNSSQYGVDWTAFAVILHAGSVTSSNFVTVVYEFNFSTSTATIFTCASGTCTSQGSGSNAVGTQPGITTLGSSGTTGNYFNGYIAEWGYRNNLNSLADIAAWSQCKYGI